MTGSYRYARLAWVALLTLLGGAPVFAKGDCFHPRAPVAALLLPPPEDTSAETAAELLELQRLQQARTPEQVEHASGDYDRSVARFLGEMHIKLRKLPRFTGRFFYCITEVTEDQVKAAKNRFKRTRPYHLSDNHLQPLKHIGEKDSYSYPSGHGAYGMTVGLILARMLPEKKQAIFARIEDFGYSRLVSGVHFRSDVYAGEVAGGAIAAALFENARFRAEFVRAKAELRKALGY